MPVLTEAERAALSIRRMIFHTIGGGGTAQLHREPPRRVETDEFFLERIREHYDGIMFDIHTNSQLHRSVQRMIDDENHFVRESKRLATMLHEKRPGMRSALCMVFLLEFGSAKCVAILKYDQQTIVRARVGTRGKKTDLSAYSDALVREKPAVEKAAIIRLHGAQKIEAAVHDRVDRAMVADYFKDFLSAVRRYSAEDLTQRVYDIFKEVANKHLDTLHFDYRDGIHRRIADTLRSRQDFDPAAPDGVIGQIFGPLESNSPVPRSIRDAFQRHQIADEPFAIHPSMIPRPSQRRLQTTEGVRITYSTAVDDLVVVAEDRLSVTIHSQAKILADDDPSGTARPNSL